MSRLLFALILVALAAAQSFGVASVNFAKVVPYGSGANGANAVVTADVNADGFPDIIVSTNNGVSVLLNNGDGTYASSATFATAGSLSNSVAVADVDGDGNLDLVVTNMCSDPYTCYGVAVLLGKGDGTFKSAVGYASGGLETGGVAVGDVNGDGLPDLVLTSNCQLQTCAGGTLTLLLNQGSGTFGAPQQLNDAKGPVSLGDVNGDSNLDLVTGAGVMLGHGDGTFDPPNPDVVGGAIAITLVDLNGDGKLDVVAAVPTGVAVQLGNGDGTLQAAQIFKTGGVNPLSVAVADFNGDNKLDLAVANECTQLVKGKCSGAATAGVLAGNGDGTFQAAVVFSSGGAFATSVAVADANQDQKVDVILSNACISAVSCDTGTVGVLLNDYVGSTVTRVVSSQSPTVVGQTVTFTATISSASTVPDGSTVTFNDGTTTLGTSTTVSGVGTLATSFSKTGVHVIKAVFGGDAYHNPSTGSMNEIVNGYPTTTAISSGSNPSNYGQTVTFTAIVASSGGVIPTGLVRFYNGTVTLGLATLDATGTATYNNAKLPLGDDSITALYQGDSLNAKSTSPVLTQTVTQAQLTMTLASTPNPSVAGKSVRFTAKLTSNGGLPTGTVVFSYNGTQLGTAGLLNGTAVYATTALPSGSDVVTATFTGNSNFSSAAASVTQTVN
jgi:hypothetical protein